MKGDTEVILFVAFFFTGVALGSILADASMEPYLNSVVSALATLAAAFFGAKYAFDLQEKKQLRDTALTQVKAGNSLISSLSRTRNKFVAFRAQFIKPHQDNPIRHYFIQPTSGVAGINLQIDYDALDFFFASTDPDYLGRLSMLEQEVISTIEVIMQRSDFHYHQLQPAIERIEKSTGPKVTPEQIDQELGTRDAQVLCMITDQMVESVDRVIEWTETLAQEANRTLNQLYPGHQVIKITYPNRDRLEKQSFQAANN